MFRRDCVALLFAVNLCVALGIAGDRGNDEHNHVLLTRLYLVGSQ
jgi:hypothetical protein